MSVIFLITVSLGRGPKTIKLFTNLTKSMDFDSAESFQAVYTLEYVIRLVLDLQIIPHSALTQHQPSVCHTDG